MELIADFVNLLVLTLEVGFLLLFLLVLLVYRGGVAAHVIQIDVHFINEVEPPAVFNVLHIGTISDTIGEETPDDKREQNRWICEPSLKILLRVMSAPKD